MDKDKTRTKICTRPAERKSEKSSWPEAMSRALFMPQAVISPDRCRKVVQRRQHQISITIGLQTRLALDSGRTTHQTAWQTTHISPRALACQIPRAQLDSSPRFPHNQVLHSADADGLQPTALTRPSHLCRGDHSTDLSAGL